MKVAVLIARILVGAIFVFFGFNLMFPFLPNPPMPPGPAKDFLTVIAVTHYMAVVGFSRWSQVSFSSSIATCRWHSRFWELSS